MKNIVKLMKKIELYDVLILSIICLFWGYIFYTFMPGIMTSDSIDQWNQVHSNVLSDIHSPLHTIMEYFLSKIWDSPSIVCIFQIALFAFIWLIICKNIRNRNKVIGFIETIVTAIIAFMPINYMYAVTLWKDVVYSYIILALVYMLYVGIKNNFKYNTIQMLCLATLIVLTMTMRHNGIIIGIILIPILLILIIKNTKGKKFVIKFLLFITALWIIIQAILSSFEIVKSATVLNKKWFSLYKIGILYQNGAITDENDLKLINDIMPLELWYRNTWDYTMNGLIYSPDMDYKKVNEHTDELWQIMIKYAIKNPKIMVNHYLKLTSVIWQLDEPKNGYTSIIQGTTYIKEGDLAHREGRNYQEISNKIDKSMRDYKILYRPAIYMYASIIIIILIVIHTRKKIYFLLLVPMIMNAISLVPMMTSQDVRYLYCNFLTFYFIIVSAIDILRTNSIDRMNKNREKNECNTIVKETACQKVLVIVPAYNEQDVIKETIEEINNKAPQCDVIVINDCSSDKTIQKVKETNVLLVDLPNNLGIGGAVQTGYKYAYDNGYDIAIQVDGDGQHDPSYISKMVEEINNGNDMVIGSRFVGKTKYKQTFMRMLGIRITSEIIKIFTNVKICDTTSGLRAVNRNIMEDFAKEYPYDYPEPCTTMQMLLKGKQIKEIKVEMRQRTTGKSSISPLKSVGYMFKVTLSLILLGLKKV